jgi:hypothetical protein
MKLFALVLFAALLGSNPAQASTQRWLCSEVDQQGKPDPNPRKFILEIKRTFFRGELKDIVLRWEKSDRDGASFNVNRMVTSNDFYVFESYWTLIIVSGQTQLEVQRDIIDGRTNQGRVIYKSKTDNLIGTAPSGTGWHSHCVREK